ncbi:hypothetical protein BJF78_00260 [Pseudonocardia sp. CNS-139]|nr:hypothetical protein BJF78_00260 [Pseudonocardia sp. CNS-139]
MHHHRQARAVTAFAPAAERRRSCGKRWYADRIAADLALALIRSRGRARTKDPVRSYHCPTCDGWHLTAIPVWRSGPHVPQQRTSSPGRRAELPAVITGPGESDSAGRRGVRGRRATDRRHLHPLRCPRSAL